MLLDPVSFPHAEDEGCDETSPKTRVYNCIAHAAGDSKRFWWPHPDAYWPKDIPLKTTVYAFLKLYRSLGYETCDDAKLEVGNEKVAIYALNYVVQHAALQLQNGHWTSKIGANIDVEHDTLKALDGPLYGSPVKFLKRPIKMTN